MLMSLYLHVFLVVCSSHARLGFLFFSFLSLICHEHALMHRYCGVVRYVMHLYEHAFVWNMILLMSMNMLGWMMGS